MYSLHLLLVCFIFFFLLLKNQILKYNNLIGLTNFIAILKSSKEYKDFYFRHCKFNFSFGKKKIVDYEDEPDNREIEPLVENTFF